MGVEARNKWTLILGEPSKVIESVSLIEDAEKTVGGVENGVKNEENETTDMEPQITLSLHNPENNIPTPKGTELQHTLVQASDIKSSSKPSRILDQVRSRKRKINSQRQGLDYLDKYDKQQAALKQKEIDLEERKLILEEKKVQLMEKQHNLAEFQAKKLIELEEKKINLEIQSRSNLEKIIERQDKLLNLLINKLT